MALKVLTSVAKRLKLKVRMFFGLPLTFVEVIGEKLIEDLLPTLHPILKSVKTNTQSNKLQNK